jgi:hypothetical protein
MMGMMTRTSRWILLMAFLLATATGSLSGQRKDFQTWYEAEVDKGLKNGIDLSAEFEQRLKNNSTRYDRTLVTLAAEYDLKDYLSTAGGLRMLLVSDNESGVHPRYRIHADARGSYSLYDVALSLRVRFQYGFEEMIYSNDIGDNSFMNRYRLKAAYHFFGTRIGVFTSLESWGLFGSNNGRFFKKMRYVAGASYELNFRSEFSLRYILEDEFNQVNPLTSYILVFGYSHSL